MAKITAWLITLVGVVLLLPLLGISLGAELSAWIIALTWFVVGITKLARNYKIIKRK